MEDPSKGLGQGEKRVMGEASPQPQISRAEVTASWPTALAGAVCSGSRLPSLPFLPLLASKHKCSLLGDSLCRGSPRALSSGTTLRVPSAPSQDPSDPHTCLQKLSLDNSSILSGTAINTAVLWRLVWFVKSVPEPHSRDQSLYTIRITSSMPCLLGGSLVRPVTPSEKIPVSLPNSWNPRAVAKGPGRAGVSQGKRNRA